MSEIEFTTYKEEDSSVIRIEVRQEDVLKTPS